MATSGNLAAKNEAGFTQAERADRNLALAGKAGVYGTSLSGANSTLGTQAHNAQTPGFWDQWVLNAQKGAADAASAGAFG
jgi:hypothetical protein